MSLAAAAGCAPCCGRPRPEEDSREADPCAAGVCDRRLSLPPHAARAGRGDVHRRHRDCRHQVRPQQRPRRQEVPARDARLGRRVPRRERRRLARHPAVNCRTGSPAPRRSLHALYRNNKNGTFTNVTAGSGLDVEMYGMGVAVGDYDNDGRDDVYITALEGDRLFHNEGNFKFRDVTKAVGHRQRELRHERRLARLRQGRPHRPLRRQLRAVDARRATSAARSTASTKSYCTPESYKGTVVEALSQPRRRQVRRT